MGSKTLNCRFRRVDPTIRLFCLPWAGGGAAFYSNWGKYLPETVEVHGICLPGRENRYGEAFYESLPTLLDDVVTAIYDVVGKDKQFALWGHSMGSYLTYETACLLKERYDIEPCHMFVSGASCVHSDRRKAATTDVKNYTDEEFIEMLKRFDGTPSDILENREWIQCFLPALKADYKLIPEIRFDHPSSRLVLTCPVSVFDGTEDTPHDLESWRDISSGEFTISMLKGGHFYLKDQANTQVITQFIANSIEGCPL